MTELRILILDDVPTDAELVERELRNAELTFTSKHVDTRETFLKELKDFSPDIILSDYSMPQFSGIEVLKLVKERFPHIPVIIVTGSINEETAVNCMKAGASDYVLKERITRLGLRVNNFLEKKRANEEKENAEEALRKSEEFKASLLENSPIPILVLNQDTSIRYVNPMLEKLTGYISAEIIGKKAPYPWWIEDPRSGDISEREKDIRTGVQRLETLFKKNDGEQFYVEVTSSPIMHKGEFKYSLTTWVDITQHKQAEAKIKEYFENLEQMVEERTNALNRALYDTEEARDRIDGILKSIGDGLIVTDIYNRVILMNRAAEDLLNIRFSEVINRPIDFAIHDKNLKDKMKDTLDKKKTEYEFDFEMPGEDINHPQIYRARTSGIGDKIGIHSGIITIFHDVTHEREVDRMKTEFVSTAAHELRTPLTSIRGFSEVLLTRDDIKKKERRKFLTYINDQSVNLSNIINDLLDISRIESGLGFSLNKSPCDIAEIIKDMVPQFQEQNLKHQFEMILKEESIQLKVDKEKMEQVLRNLFSNAVKYSPEGGLIQVTSELSEGYYQVSIKDQGIGMPREQVAKIFDKFYRADASNTAIHGTGLGMSIVKYLVEAHGGEIWAESEAGKGVMVTFTIPIGKLNGM